MFRPRLVEGPSESLWAIGLFLSLSPNGDFERSLISYYNKLFVSARCVLRKLIEGPR